MGPQARGAALAAAPLIGPGLEMFFVKRTSNLLRSGGIRNGAKFNIQPVRPLMTP